MADQPQSWSSIHIHSCSFMDLPRRSHTFRSSQGTGLSSLHSLPAGSLHRRVCIFNPSLPVPPPSLGSHIHFLRLHLSSCPAVNNRFIHTIFLDSTYTHWYMILVFSFWLTSLYMTDYSVYLWDSPKMLNFSDPTENLRFWALLFS